MKIHYLQHVPFEGLGYIETWLTQNNHTLTSTAFFEENYTLPKLEEIDALIILGGPMSVYDETLYPWLIEEKAFIKACLYAGKKVLGICLGAQLMSVCLDAKVSSATNKEIGWFPIFPTKESQDIPWLYELFQNNPTVFHWHGELFDIPEGSLNVLSSQANTNQAFYFNKDIIGLQFHLEVTAETTALMLMYGKEELHNGQYIQTVEEIRNGLIAVGQCNEMMGIILENWMG